MGRRGLCLQSPKIRVVHSRGHHLCHRGQVCLCLRLQVILEALIFCQERVSSKIAYVGVSGLCRRQCGWEKVVHFKSPLSPQEKDEQCWLFVYFFITTRDSSGAFPESVRAGRTQRYIHHKSQHHRLFILAERPTSEAKPIKSLLPCPSACHLAHISPKTLLHSHNFSFFFMSHLSLFLAQLFPFSVCCHSITFLTSNEERSCIENNEVMQRFAL